MFFLDTDTSVLHTDSMFASIKNMASRKSNNWLNGDIHTCFESLPFSWSSEIIDIWLLMNLGSEPVPCELTDNMKSALCHCCLNSSADISDEVSSFRLGNTSSESVFCYFNTTNMTSIFWFSNDNGCRSIGEISLIANTIVYLHDITRFKWYIHRYTMNHNVIH